MSKLKLVCIVALVGTVCSNRDLDLWIRGFNENPRDVQKALAKGANPNWKNPESLGETVLHVASGMGHLAVVDTLLNTGANTDIQDNFNRTALYLAVSSASEETNKLAVVKVLLAAGANKDLLDHYGRSALHVAIDPEIVKTLLATGINKDLQDENGWTPVYSASAYGHKDVVAALAESGADINIQCYRGQTPLIVASTPGYLDTIMVLIDSQANVTLSDNKGRTALHVAARKNESDIALVLLRAGSDTKRKDEEGNTPEDVAREKGFTELADMINNYAKIITNIKTVETNLTISSILSLVANAVHSSFIIAGEVIVFLTMTLIMVSES